MLKDNKKCFLFSIAFNNFASDQSPECSITSPADLQINQSMPCHPLINRTLAQCFNKALLKTPAGCFEYPILSYFYI